MPRKNHIANGSASRIDPTPKGRNSVFPSVGAMFQSDPQSNAPVRSDIAPKTTMMPIEMIETTIANPKEMFAPAALRAMNSA